jgi:murein DD-endopeptidase MepM/ murein hydrolase activator NlpD
VTSRSRNTGDVEALNRENRALSSQLEREVPQLREKVQSLSAAVARAQKLEAQLRSFTQLTDPARNIALGPIQAPGHEGDEGVDDAAQETSAAAPADPTTRELELRLLKSRSERMGGQVETSEKNLGELLKYFDKQRVLLASTPSIWPVRGWLSSVFGVRKDPFTGNRGMHRGLDIVTEKGIPIIAAADGVVATAQTDSSASGFGRHVVVDHGRGVTTIYGHMSSVAVKQGEKVQRGAKLGLVGSTGRSTGPHLHYEVRLDGVPQNPHRFILD